MVKEVYLLFTKSKEFMEVRPEFIAVFSSMKELVYYLGVCSAEDIPVENPQIMISSLNSGDRVWVQTNEVAELIDEPADEGEKRYE